MTQANDYLKAAHQIIIALGLPEQQQNERSALCLLALTNMTPGRSWSRAENPLRGITPIMDWSREHYGKHYAPNSRETFRRQTMHQFCDVGIAIHNPDNPDRPVNSPMAVYQIEANTLALLRTYDTPAWHGTLAAYQSKRDERVAQHAKDRHEHRVPVTIAQGEKITLSAGPHSELIKAVIEAFAPRFAPASAVIYVGDTGKKWGYFDAPLLAELSVDVDPHGKMPDVILYDKTRGWLILIEAVTSHGPIDRKRHRELARVFAKSTAALVYVTVFPNRTAIASYLSNIAWETEVWVGDEPSHLIHFDGDRLLGPRTST